MRGVDPDGDRLTFGVSGPDAELVKLEQQGDNQVGGWWGGKWSKMIKIIFNQADLFLAQSLDHEAAAEHQVTFDDDNDEVVIMIMIMMRRGMRQMRIILMVDAEGDNNYDKFWRHHQVLLTLTDGHLGRDNFISQSVIIMIISTILILRSY